MSQLKYHLLIENSLDHFGYISPPTPQLLHHIAVSLSPQHLSWPEIIVLIYLLIPCFLIH